MVFRPEGVGVGVTGVGVVTLEGVVGAGVGVVRAGVAAGRAGCAALVVSLSCATGDLCAGCVTLDGAWRVTAARWRDEPR